ncbi:MAG TPA: peptidoglycan DD-metalloendopeptidase family protein [Gammaproteobacteria bacterium]|nr:peptidoglycan DD-metalloendopeptidase family protein [Gammaproteobacteria bacterium]
MHKSITAACRQARPVHWLIAAVAATVVLSMLFSGGAAEDIHGPALATRLAGGALDLPLELPVAARTLSAAPKAANDTHTVTVKSGDTLSAIFSREGLSAGQLAAIMALDSAKPLTRIFPGDKLNFSRTPDGMFHSLSLVLADNSQLTITRSEDGYEADRATLPVLEQTAYAHGVIESSLFGAAMDAGLPDSLTMALIHLFAWDIDFAHDVQPGDSFTVLYQHTYSARDGTDDGPILAASFHTNGHVYTAIRYTDAGGHTGYYTADGHNVRKAFLRAPVDYTRVSSGFSMRRMNPVLHYVRPHLGTDFAAPQGTPIHVTADGRIIYRARKGGYGNAVVVKHAGRYSTLYGHMSRFARGQHVGSHVKQGEIIGYVGHTGVATGPHVHYEFRINGVHKDPLEVNLPAARPIAKQYRKDYEKFATSLLAQLQFAEGERIVAAQ